MLTFGTKIQLNVAVTVTYSTALASNLWLLLFVLMDLGSDIYGGRFTF